MTNPAAPKLVEVLFHGPTHVLEAFGQKVKRGETALFHESEIFALQAESRIRIEVLGTPEPTETHPRVTHPRVTPEPEADLGAGQTASEQEE